MVIGIDATRGDRITVQNLSFVALPGEIEIHPTLDRRVQRVMQDWSTPLKYLGIAVLFLFLYITFLRPLKNRVVASIAEAKPTLTTGQWPAALSGAAPTIGGAGSPALEDSLPDFSNELTDASSEVKRAVVLKRHLVDKIKTEPAAASRLIENWVRQSEA